MTSSTLTDLIASRRVIITVGSGGVGKTTTAAAIGLAGARMGRRVLVLTIDPAKRLATSLGLREMRAEAQPIDPAVLGPSVKGSLVAMMLDVRRTFDELVARYAADEEVRDRIYANKIYRAVAGSLAGTPEYMAMEKLHSVKGDPAYDLIVLDTPPTANALDFLEAPDRMIAAIDSPTIRAFVQAFEGAGRLSLNLLSKAMAKVLSGLGKFTGAGFLEQIAEFLSDIQSLFGGFKERATRVREELKGSDVAFVIVTSPDPMAVGEAMFFAERLAEGGMRTEALVVNRVRKLEPVEVSAPNRVANVLRDAGVEPAMDLAAAAIRAHQDGMAWAKRDASEVARVRRELRSISRVVEVPAFDEDVYDLAALGHVADYVAPPTR
jgi:anion-transporting  ArsA/GET3 family ATPase